MPRGNEGWAKSRLSILRFVAVAAVMLAAAVLLSGGAEAQNELSLTMELAKTTNAGLFTFSHLTT